MTNNYETISLEAARDIIEPKLRRYYKAMSDAAEKVMYEIINTGQLSKQGRDAFADENILQATILGNDYRNAARVRKIELPEDYIDNLERRLIAANDEKLEEMIRHLDYLAAENWITSEN